MDDVTLPETLEALSQISGIQLFVKDGGIHSGGRSREHPLRPPTQEEMQLLRRTIDLKAREMDLQRVVSTVARFLHLSAVVPATESMRKVSVASHGANVAQVLEQISVQAELTVWIDGKFLRVNRNPRPVPPRRKKESAFSGSIPIRLTLQARNKPLGQVLRLLAARTHKLLCLPARIQRQPVTVIAENLPLSGILATLSVPPFRVYQDGPFFRVAHDRDRMYISKRSGKAWKPFLDLLYQEATP
jgi:type II secretory pathway component GspD/PulD (secretin)